MHSIVQQYTVLINSNQIQQANGCRWDKVIVGIKQTAKNMTQSSIIFIFSINSGKNVFFFSIRQQLWPCYAPPRFILLLLLLLTPFSRL